MHSSLMLSALAIAIPSVFAIPPESFGFPSAPNDTALTVVYTYNGNKTTIQEAQLLGSDVPMMQPTIAVDQSRYRSLANYNGKYLVMMVDPDAKTPANPSERFILHWMAPNMTVSTTTAGTAPNGPGMVLTNSTPNFVPYARPMPPPTSPAHRYIQYAFEQPDDFEIPAAFMGYSATNRSMFNLTEFISAAGLSSPASAMFYFCSNQTGVPGGFQALAGGQYPNGNGAIITAGTTPAAAATSGASMTSGSMASMTSGAMASGTIMPAAASAGAIMKPATWASGLVAAVAAFAFYAL